MAADANMGDAAPAAAAEVLDSIKPPAGVIIPPPGEIREAIEKTAGYVMRGGPGLEARIRDNHGANPKFSFLMSSSDPYNAYYEWRKDEIKAGRGNAVSAGRVGEAAVAPAKQEPKGPGKPPDFQFSPRMPRMSQIDLEVVRLTALFVAKNGRQFMTQLAQREAGNPQYQFLIPNHTFHNFFQSMVDQYSLLVREGGVNGEGTKARQERAAELQRMVDDKFYVLGRAKQRAEYAKWLEAEKKKKEEEEEKTQIEFARIDWNDFVVVETIVFGDADEQAALPPPTSLNELQYASLEEKNKMSVSANLRIEEAFPFDDMGSTPATRTYSSGAAPVQSQHAPPTVTANYGPAAPVGGYSGHAQPVANSRAAQADEDAQQRIQEREQARIRMQHAQTEAKGGAGPMKIRENYVPRAAAKAASRTEMAICPNCKQQIPINELQEHMRSTSSPCTA
jgi:splicing factor 3A subunit 1